METNYLVVMKQNFAQLICWNDAYSHWI